MSMSNIFEHGNVVSILYPSDMQTAVADDWIYMGNAHSIDIICFFGAGVANDDPDIHITQATTNSGGSEKGVNITRYYLKQGTLLSTSSIGGTFTVTTQAASYVISLDASSAETQQIVGIHVSADELDVTNGFDWIRASVPDTGSAGAKLGCILGILHPARFSDDSGGVNPL